MEIFVRELADVPATLPGALAVALGGSRAAGDADGGSDWDLTAATNRPAILAGGVLHPPHALGRDSLPAHTPSEGGHP